ncbi:MAG: TIGR03545 family protein [Planctomycetaceae bacterium]
MRWSYLIPRLILVAILWAAMAFGFDPLLRYSAITGLQSITGAKADIESLSTGFFPPRLTIDGVALASAGRPGTNLMEFRALTMTMNGDSLLRKSFVVEEATMTGIRFGTARSDNGKLEVAPEPEDTEPSWLAEKLRSIGDEWLEDLTAQAKAQVDPNTLETYRTGRELHEKWDARFDVMSGEVGSLKQQVDALRQQMDAAKKTEPLQQIEMYLQIAQRADLLLREAQQMKSGITGIVPEVQQDFARLNQARLNDQEMVVRKVKLLKPDARRISESLIGEEMYLQLQQVLSWLETAQEYQHDLQHQVKPERIRGTDFEFELFNPTPRLLCRKVLLDGEFRLNGQPAPFQGVLTDVTSDAHMHGVPAVLKVKTSGERPLQLLVRYDATTENARTEILADYIGDPDKRLSIGKPDKVQMLTSLKQQHWNAELVVENGEIAGRIELNSELGETACAAPADRSGILSQMLADVSSSIHHVNATVQLTGTLKKPHVSIASDVGEQFSAGLQTALDAQVAHLKTRLVAEVDRTVAEQREKLTAGFGKRYDELLADNADVVTKIQQAQQLVATLRSGRVDPNQVIRQVSESGLLKEKDQQKLEKTLGEGNKVLGGLKDPNEALRQAVPKLGGKLFR